MTPILFAAQSLCSSAELPKLVKNGRPVRCALMLALSFNVLLGLAIRASSANAALQSEPTSLSSEDEAFFEANIRPLLVKRCLECHSGAGAEAELRLDTAAGVRAGSEQGMVIDWNDLDSSRLLKAVRRTEDVPAMPPDEPLTPQELAAFEQWVRRGVPDPRTEADRRLGGMSLDEGKAWWSFQPIEPNSTPIWASSVRRDSIDGPIDAYLAEASARLQIESGEQADRRTLLRRLTYDLTGLPPHIEHLEQFASDQRPDAVAREVDRLLASHAYGERWGRHWLDLVRYADTAGENSDHPLPHAWRYRNWVIDAWNQDASIDDFIRWQIAGDLIAQESSAAIDESERGGPIVATGYLAIARRFGHDSNKDMHLTYEDAIDTLGKSLLGLSLGCARCHAHKYDPVSAEDYYSLYGILASTRFSFAGCEAIQQPSDLVSIVSPERWRQRFETFQTRREEVTTQLNQALAELDQATQAFRHANQQTPLFQSAIEQAGEANWELQSENQSPRVLQLKAGQGLLLTIGPKGNYGADSTRVNLTIRATDSDSLWDATQDLLDDFLLSNPNEQPDGSLWVLLDGRTYQPLGERVENLEGKPGLHVWRQGELPSVFVTTGNEPVPVWTTLPARTLFVHPASDGPVALAWIAPRDCSITVSGQIADAHGEGGDGVDFRLDLVTQATNELQQVMRESRTKVARLQAELDQLNAQIPEAPVAFAVQEGTPHDEAVQLKGEPEHLGAVVSRRWIEVLGHQPLGNETESGRRALAESLVPSHSPLAARVFVNRLWAHLFGRGLVRSLNDFGARGDLPTHPQLLDRLAQQLIDADSAKSLQREIVLSHAYRRASLINDAATVGAENRQQARPAGAVSIEQLGQPLTLADYRERDPNLISYAYFERRRLSAEELRDSLLFVSSQLDWNIGQAHPFPAQATWGFTQHQPFADSYPHSRRSVYMMVKRNRRDPFLALFDGADPSATTPQRQVTTVPTQALFFFNDPFFHERAAALVAQARTNTNDLDSLIDQLTRNAWQRSATDRELQVLRELWQRWPKNPTTDSTEADRALARVVLAASEFLYVD